MNRVIRIKVQVIGRWAAIASGYRIDRRSTFNSEALVISIDTARVGDQRVKRATRHCAERCADGQREFPREGIASVELELVWSVIRQPTEGVIQQLRQIEKARDVRVGLSVVVSEETFIISDQARVNIRRDELIVV